MNTVNIHVLSRTKRDQFWSVSNHIVVTDRLPKEIWIQGKKLRYSVTKCYLDLADRTHFIVVIRTHHTKLHELGLEPYPASLGPEYEEKYSTTEYQRYEAHFLPNAN